MYVFNCRLLIYFNHKLQSFPSPNRKHTHTYNLFNLHMVQQVHTAKSCIWRTTYVQNLTYSNVRHKLTPESYVRQLTKS